MISVTFRKAVSDGNYGTESAEVSLQIELEDGQAEAPVVVRLLSEARTLAQSELNQSPSIAVRRALQRQEPVAPRGVPADEAPF